MTDRSPSSRYRSPFGWGVRLGRVLGLDVVADWSLLLIFALVAINLGAGLLPQWHPNWTTLLTWTVALGAAALFFVSIWLHEMSHALIARAFGMHVHGITLFVFGGVAQIAGEPPSAGAELLIAGIGPVTSLVIGVVVTFAGTTLAAGALTDGGADTLTALAGLGPVATLLLWLGPVNIMLGLFNLVPGFPLDGGRVLRAVVWGVTHNLVRATRIAALSGQTFAWLLITAGILSVFGIPVPVLGGSGVQGLWLVLIGWFLNNAARASYQQLMLRQALQGVPAARLMSSSFPVVEPHTSLSALDGAWDRERIAYVPVVSSDAQRFLGLLSAEDTRKLSADERSRVTVEQVMTPAAQLFTMLPNDDAAKALESLTGGNIPIPVVDGGELRGLIRQRDLVEWLSTHVQLEQAS